jgi:hypothetical protein
VACATADHGVLRRCYPTSPARHQTTLRQSGPGSYALDGAQTSFGNARSHRFRMRLAVRRSASSGDRRCWRRSPPCAGLFGRSAGSTSVPLTPLSSAAARRPSRDDVKTTVQIRCHPSHVNATGLPESERLSSTSALRRVLSHFAVCESPPPISRLRRQRSGFRRFFTPPSLSRGGARPARVIRELFAHGLEGPRAARRLLQSIRSTSTTTFVRAS